MCINKEGLLRNCNRKDWPVTICNSIFEHHDLETIWSWLMYYLGGNFEDESLSIVIKLGYLILSQKMDEISAAAMWQEPTI